MFKNTVYEYDYWLGIGTLNQIRSEIYNLKGVQINGWEFTDDLEGWSLDPKGGTVEQSDGKLKFTVGSLKSTEAGDLPSVDNVLESWDPADLRYLWLSMKNKTAGDSGAFHFFHDAGGKDSVAYSLSPNDTEFKDVLIDLDTLDFWTGDALYNKFRLQAVTSFDPGTVHVDFIRFLESLIHIRSEGDVSEISGLGNSLQLYAELIPDMNAAEVDWSVDFPEFASVSASGILTAVSEGIVTVTATSKDGSGMPASLTMEIIDDVQRTSWEFIKDEYATEKAALEAFVIFSSDPDARYDQVIEHDVSLLEPLVTFGYKPDQVKPVREMETIKIDQVYIGSCTNGRIEDLRVAARVLNGKKISDSVRGIVSPATSKVFSQAMDDRTGRRDRKKIWQRHLANIHGFRILRYKSDLRSLSRHEQRHIGRR